jgi:hypothetical protein
MLSDDCGAPMVDGLTAYVPPDGGDPGWRVRFCVGLVQDSPMSEQQRAAFEREEARERAAAALEAQQRHERAIELRWDLQRQGVVARSHAEILEAASLAGDRDDRRAARLEREAAEQMGLPEPRLDRWELKREQQQREAEALTAPATKAEVSKLSQAVTQLKSKLHAQGRRSADQDYHQPRPYFRSGGGIVRGPY